MVFNIDTSPENSANTLWVSAGYNSRLCDVMVHPYNLGPLRKSGAYLYPRFHLKGR
jgi:hypothetical protein